MNELDIKSLFGQRLKSLRIKKDLTQAKLAEIINVQPKHISCIENGKTFPSAEIIAELAKAFELHPRELFDFAEAPTAFDLKKDIIKSLEKATPLEIEKIYIYTKFIVS